MASDPKQSSDRPGYWPLPPLRFQPRALALWSQPYSRNQAATDVLSGITVGLIALPLALALGVASIPAGTVTPFPAPAIGIFTAIIGGFIVSLLGGSRVQIAGPTAAFVTVILLIVEKHGFDGLLLATVMAGVMSPVVLTGATEPPAMSRSEASSAHWRSSRTRWWRPSRRRRAAR